MNRALLFASIALAIAGGALVACTSDSSPASPTVPPATGASGNGNRDSGSGTVADTGAPGEGGTAGDASDAGSNVVPDGGDAGAVVVACPDVPDGGDAGYATVAAGWSFAVSVATLNGGKGQLLTVRRCDSVVWTNTDVGTPHSVVSDPGAGFGFSTIARSSGAFPAIQFAQAGTFGYQCGIHGTMMIGEITVQP